jgi:hypothetical protein
MLHVSSKGTSNNNSLMCRDHNEASVMGTGIMLVITALLCVIAILYDL